MRVGSLLDIGMGTQRFTSKIHATAGHFCLLFKLPGRLSGRKESI